MQRVRIRLGVPVEPFSDTTGESFPNLELGCAPLAAITLVCLKLLPVGFAFKAITRL